MSAPLLDGYFQSYDRVTREKEAEKRRRGTRRTALENCLSFTAKSECNGFQRIRRCRQALEALDRRGWQRSKHPKLVVRVGWTARSDSRKMRRWKRRWHRSARRYASSSSWKSAPR